MQHVFHYRKFKILIQVHAFPFLGLQKPAVSDVVGFSFIWLSLGNYVSNWLLKKGRNGANEEEQKRERLWICSPMNSHVVNHIVRRMAPTRETNITAITKYFLQLYILCK